MAFFSNSLSLDFLVALASILYFIYWYINRNKNYWIKRGVESSDTSIFNEIAFGKKSVIDSITDVYHKYSDKRFLGLFQFTTPMLMVFDVDLVQNVLVKDFIHFQDRGQPQYKNDPLLLNLIGYRGQKWRALRNKLTPTFSSGKLKNMFEQVSKSGNSMIEKLEQLRKENDDIDSKSFMFEFTVDVIASCAFGVQFPPDSPEFKKFTNIVKRIFEFSAWRLIKQTTTSISPTIASYLGMKSLPKEDQDYFVGIVKNNSKFRRENNIRRNDYFQLLLTLKEQEESGKNVGIKADDGDIDTIVDQMKYTHQDNQLALSNIKYEAITANTFIFLTAGSETLSNTVSFVLFELSQHLDIQKRVQQEVDLVLAKHGGWSYDTIKDMTYLDQVVQESQRLHPLVPMIVRECVQTYEVPKSDLVIEKGTFVSIPVIGLHKDSKYYPDPERFDPDRFKDNNFKPSPTFLPFGDGPRICIGMRFAIMELKTFLARILSQYSVRLSNKTQVPLKIKLRSFIHTVDGGMWLRFEKRKASEK